MALMGKHTPRHESTGHRDPSGQAEAVLALLDNAYGPAPWVPSGKPVDELVATILSQNTSDTNTERAFSSLRERFPTWQAVRDAPTGAVAEAIRAGGLADQKAPRIQKILTQILDDQVDDQNARLLQALRSRDLDDAMDWLTSFSGVGPKTAACVLLFAVGMPALPVDTHVHRVAQRLGLIDEHTDANRAHELLRHQIPPDAAYRFHVQMIKHGRTVCRARNPRCDSCILAHICQYRSRIVESA